MFIDSVDTGYLLRGFRTEGWDEKTKKDERLYRTMNDWVDYHHNTLASKVNEHLDPKHRPKHPIPADIHKIVAIKNHDNAHWTLIFINFTDRSVVETTHCLAATDKNSLSGHFPTHGC